MLCLFGAMEGVSAIADNTEESSSPKGQSAGSQTQVDSGGTGANKMLYGTAEVAVTRDSNQRAWIASQLYRRGSAALDQGNYRLAADCFKQAGVGFDQMGFEKLQAQTAFAEAQSRRLLGEAKQSARLYQLAVDLFNQYDPLSPYLKAALDNLEKVSPSLKGKVEQNKARLQALKNPKAILTVDRNVVLKSGLSKYGSNLLAEKQTADIPSDYVQNVIHKAFLKLICLETAELGSNYITAENRWYPLIANGKTVTVSASSDLMTPVISVKINERFFNIDVDLPDLGSSKRTVFLLTDKTHIIAIDPATEDMWHLIGDFKLEPPKFTWKKFTHFKPKPPKA